MFKQIMNGHSSHEFSCLQITRE